MNFSVFRNRQIQEKKTSKNDNNRFTLKTKQTKKKKKKKGKNVERSGGIRARSRCHEEEDDENIKKAFKSLTTSHDVTSDDVYCHHKPL